MLKNIRVYLNDKLKDISIWCSIWELLESMKGIKFMYPKLFEQSSLKNSMYNKIITVIKTFDSQQYFSLLIGKT